MVPGSSLDGCFEQPSSARNEKKGTCYMAYRSFVVPIRDSGRIEAELNTFLRSHQVLSVDCQWVEDASNSFWAYRVEYFDSAVPAAQAPKSGRSRVDYREVLSPEDFAVFAQLRDLRKLVAQAESVPMYVVFTNEHLSKIVQSRAKTKADLEAITGVGDSRVEKYGARFLEFLQQQWNESNEESGKSVSGDH
jgi:superfamily II DNA helicase RecQ